MSPRDRNVVLILAAVVAIGALYSWHYGGLATLLGVVAFAWAIVDVLRKPAPILSRCLILAGLLLWGVELVLATLDTLPQAGWLVSVLFFGGFCLAIVGSTFGSKGRTQ